MSPCSSGFPPSRSRNACSPRAVSTRPGGIPVAIDVASGELYAPFGLDELERGVLRCNPLTPQPELFVRKAESYRARWPWLTLID